MTSHPFYSIADLLNWWITSLPTYRLFIHSFARSVTFLSLTFSHVAVFGQKFWVCSTCVYSNVSCQSLASRKRFVICMLTQSNTLDHLLACSVNSFCWQVWKECGALTSGMLGMWQLGSLNFLRASAAQTHQTMNVESKHVGPFMTEESCLPWAKAEKASQTSHLRAHMRFFI